MIIHSTEGLNPLSPRKIFETMIGRFLSDIALGASKIRQRSLMLSVADNRQSLADRRAQFEEATADYIERLVSLGNDHGLEPLKCLDLNDLEIVRLATALLNREEAAAATGPDPLNTFADELFVQSLRELSQAISNWEWIAATESPNECSPKEAGALVLDRLAKATAAAAGRDSRCGE